MRATLTNHLLALLLLAVATGNVAAHGNVAAEPSAGSQLALEENRCATCHGEEGKQTWVSDPPHEDDRPHLFVSGESLTGDVHFLEGVNCHDCHGGDPGTLDVPQAHSREVPQGSKGVQPFRSSLDEVKKACGHCHKEELASLRASVHRHGGEKDEKGSGKILGCLACHGSDSHGMLPAEDPRSPVFLDHQIEACGGCHQEDLETYSKSVHGVGLFKSGLVVVPACADCHGSHGIYYAADKRSTLHTSKVATTCGQCHDEIENRLQQSVHGRGNGPGGATEKPAPPRKWKRKPTCTDCHQGHRLLDPEQAAFQLESVNRCDGKGRPALRYAKQYLVVAPANSERH